MIEMSQPWEPPQLANFGHAIPHVNFSFDEQSNQFQPYRGSYQETLLFYSLLPMSLLLLLLLIYLMYFCARDWSTQVQTTSKCFPSLLCSSFSLSLFTTLILALAYTSFFMLKADFDEIIDSAEVMEGAINGINGDKRNINKTIQNVKRELQATMQFLADSGLDSDEKRQLHSDIKRYRKNYPIYDQKDIVVGNESQIPQYEDLKENLLTFESYRLYLTIGLIGTLVIVAILSWSTTCFKQSAVFIVSIVASFIALLLLHLAFGLSLALSVGISDFCMAPSEFIEDNVVKLDWLNQNEVDFFFKCNTDHHKYNRILDLEADLVAQKAPLLKFMTVKSSIMSDSMLDSLGTVLSEHKSVVSKVNSFVTMMDCETIKSAYRNILNVTCNNYLLFWWIFTFLIAGCLTLICICLVVLPMVMSKSVRIDRDTVDYKTDFDRVTKRDIKGRHQQQHQSVTLSFLDPNDHDFSSARAPIANLRLAPLCSNPPA